MSDSHIFLNRPEAKEHNVRFVPHPEPNNPVVRGLPLRYLASAVANLPVVSGVLWSNAGFGKLKDVKGLDGVEPRYDPTVVKTTGTASKEADLASLLAEDWTSKLPESKVFPSALAYHEAYKSGSLTPTAVAKAMLPFVRRDLAEHHECSNAFIETKVELVFKAAEESTQRYREGRPLSPLDGVPVAVKDEVDLKGYGKTLGSKLDLTNKDNVTSFCVQKWIDAGAVIVGKTNMHEFGLDTTNLNPVHGTPVNPYNRAFYPGGSSGGSASAIASGLVPVALGADGGGSIRIPSSYCGIYGLKPSHNRVSGSPTPSLAASTGVLGPMASNMADLELAYRVMATPDASNATQSLFPPPSPILHPSHQKTRKKPILALCTTWLNRADPSVQNLFNATLTHLTKTLSYETITISLPHLHAGQQSHALTILAEIAASTSKISSLTSPNKILLSTGSQTPAPIFLQAQKIRHAIMQHLSSLFAAHSEGLIVLTPCTPNAGWRRQEGEEAYGASNANMSVRAMEYVWLANFTGCPAVTAPMGYANVDGKGSGSVPVGIMAMGEWGGEEALLGFGYEMERYLESEWEGGRRRPEFGVDLMKRAREGM